MAWSASNQKRLVGLSALLLVSLLYVPAAAGERDLRTTIVPSATFRDHLPPTPDNQELTAIAGYFTPSSTPTITPTLGKLITRTPVPPSQCPAATNTALSLGFGGVREESLAGYGDAILNFLNAGGTIPILEQAVNKQYRHPLTAAQLVWKLDVTGDAVADVVVDFKPPFMQSFLYVFTCREGRYAMAESSLVTDEAGNPAIKGIHDMNGNGIPEIVYFYQPHVGVRGGGTHVFLILEWNGQRFVDLVEGRNTDNQNPLPPALAGPEIDGAFGGIRDHGNGTSELVLIAPSPKDSHYGGSITGRRREHIWAWNGVAFTYLCSRAAEPAAYRVHAAEDGDNESRCGRYEQAMVAYQRAIFDNNLLGWTNDTTIHQEATPYFDPDERTYLSAYARYRIILVHVLRNRLEEAQTDYGILQKLYPEGTTGHQFAGLARAFWEGYHAQRSVAAGCQRAVEYTTGRAEVILALNKYAYCDGSGGPCDVVFPLYGADQWRPQGDVTAICPFNGAPTT